jgi:UDP-glucose 4-epimerase
MLHFSPTILNFFTGKRLIITGASGYIGSQLVSALATTECTITRISRDKTKLAKIDGTAEIIDIEGSIQDIALWHKILPGIDVVFHLSAQTNLYKAEADPVADWQCNVLPMINLLECCKQTKQSVTVIAAGTATEVGLVTKLPVNEQARDFPISIYDLHKLAAENYLKHYSAAGYVKGVTLRLANVYGPGPASVNQNRGIINMMAARALKGEPLTIYGAGEFIRDYIFVQDVLQAFLMAAPAINQLNLQHVLIGSGEGRSIVQAITSIARQAEAITGNCAEVTHIDCPEGIANIEKRDFIADYSTFSAQSGWEPAVTFETGINLTLNYLSDNGYEQ